MTLNLLVIVNIKYSWRDNKDIPPEERWQHDPDYWINYKYNSKNFKKKKTKEEVCSTADQLQNKGDIKELPDSCSKKYVYDMEVKVARKALENVWKNSEAKADEVLSGLKPSKQLQLQN